MRCEELQEILFEDPRAEGQEVHLEQCAACRVLQQDLLAMSAALGDRAQPTLPEGFALSLRRQLTRAATSPGSAAEEAIPRLDEGPRRRWGERALLAAAAAVILLVGGTLILRSSGPDRQTPPIQHYKLQLSVHATTHHPEAEFQLILPRHVQPQPGLASIMSHEGSLRWVSALRPGENQIAIPLTHQGTTPARVRAQLTVDGKTLITEIELKTLGPATSRTRRDETRGDQTREEEGSTFKIAWVLDQEIISTSAPRRLP